MARGVDSADSNDGTVDGDLSSRSTISGRSRTVVVSGSEDTELTDDGVADITDGDLKEMDGEGVTNGDGETGDGCGGEIARTCGSETGDRRGGKAGETESETGETSDALRVADLDVSMGEVGLGVTDSDDVVITVSVLCVGV